MSEVRLVVREAAHDWTGTVHGSLADCAIAGLSADPSTLAELQAACVQFARPALNRPFFANLAPGICDEPYDAGIVVIDLIARLVLVDSTYLAPGAKGEVRYHDGRAATDTWLGYHLADDWLFTSDRYQWRALAEKRRRERMARPAIDARSVLYGRPLLEFLARETFAAFERTLPIASTPPNSQPDGISPADSDLVYDTLKQIHADWLLTPRDDLGGACPREVALERHKHLSRDLQDRCQRWTLLGECPPGLDKSSLAFRFGGFGTHELVQYYHLVRELLWCCWQSLIELATMQSALTVGDFLAGEVARLEIARDRWFQTPNPEYHGRTPRSIIDRERARLPETMAGADAMVDEDCPCCQMMADMPGPMFWNLDGSGMDDDFAFDIYHRTREGWEAEQRKWEDYNQRFNAEWAERERRGETGFGEASSEEPVWSSSFSMANNEEVPPEIRLFGIAAHLAELVADVRQKGSAAADPPEVGQCIDQLNRDFGNLREILQKSEPSVADALVEPVFERFAESLAEVAQRHPDLSAKCESLTSSLARLLRLDPLDSSWDTDNADEPL